jgi:hypothetical protein
MRSLCVIHFQIIKYSLINQTSERYYIAFRLSMSFTHHNIGLFPCLLSKGSQSTLSTTITEYGTVGTMYIPVTDDGRGPDMKIHHGGGGCPR